MDKSNLGEFLHRNSGKSNAELAEDIRKAKKLSNKHDNVVVYQEKKSMCATAEKLLKIIKAFNKDAELQIKLNNKQWKQD